MGKQTNGQVSQGQTAKPKKKRKKKSEFVQKKHWSGMAKLKPFRSSVKLYEETVELAEDMPANTTFEDMIAAAIKNYGVNKLLTLNIKRLTSNKEELDKLKADFTVGQGLPEPKRHRVTNNPYPFEIPKYIWKDFVKLADLLEQNPVKLARALTHNFVVQNTVEAKDINWEKAREIARAEREELNSVQ